MVSHAKTEMAVCLPTRIFVRHVLRVAVFSCGMIVVRDLTAAMLNLNYLALVFVNCFVVVVCVVIIVALLIFSNPKWIGITFKF